MKWWDNYLNKKFDAIRERERLELERIALEEQEKRIEEQRLVAIAIEEHRAKMKASNEPWFDFSSEEYNNELGFAIKTDWNSAMIKYLKANGFTGNTDEDIVHSYIRAVSLDVERRDNTDDFSDVPDTEDSNA